ncbi:DNA recombination protein RmuC [Rhodothermus profundi]|uniref:DNA recombination protein RmuC n=1 Tax=Rhodothermus profundi TaxID=633813 RepID=A0A1M6SLR9_9BACT|nr:DNA recombination protein RmuC [Rhodothermus profundi]SHK45701.1 DNA recombination protein RmuC [Rhodothermus profundi]
MELLIFTGIGLGTGALLTWWLLHQQTVALRRQVAEQEQLLREAAACQAEAAVHVEQARALQQRCEALVQENAALRAQIARLEEALKAGTEKIVWLEQAEQRLREAFQALAGEMLRENSGELLRHTRETLEVLLNQVRSDWDIQKAEFKGLVQPLDETLKSLGEQIRLLEQKREKAYGALEQHLRQLFEAHQALQQQTQQLTSALRSGTQQRGRWAEFQLQRLVELAGMQQHVDFKLQVRGETGRPDLVVYLPGGGCVVVDAKAPMTDYFQALDSQDAAKRQKLFRQHARSIRQHIQQLAGRAYWHQFENAPDFTVMFIPTDACLHAAFEADPDLLEYAYEQRVALATPTTLLALLKAIAFGWQQHQMAENARQIARESETLLHRLDKFAEHLQQLGHRLGLAVETYNRAVGSFSSRLLPAVRRLRTLQGRSDEVEELLPVDRQIRPVLVGRNKD